MAHSQDQRARTTAREEIDADVPVQLAVASLYGDAWEQVEKATAVLDMRIGQLYERLGPVLTGWDDGDENRISEVEKAPRSAGEVVDRLRAHSQQLYGLAATLDTVHRRLVLPGDIY